MLHRKFTLYSPPMSSTGRKGVVPSTGMVQCAKILHIDELLYLLHVTAQYLRKISQSVQFRSAKEYTLEIDHTDELIVPTVTSLHVSCYR